MNTKHFMKIILSLMACCMLLNACALQTRKVLYSYNDSSGKTPVKKYEVVQERRYEKHIKSYRFRGIFFSCEFTDYAVKRKKNARQQPYRHALNA